MIEGGNKFKWLVFDGMGWIWMLLSTWGVPPGWGLCMGWRGGSLWWTDRGQPPPAPAGSPQGRGCSLRWSRRTSSESETFSDFPSLECRMFCDCKFEFLRRSFYFDFVCLMICYLSGNSYSVWPGQNSIVRLNLVKIWFSQNAFFIFFFTGGALLWSNIT